MRRTTPSSIDSSEFSHFLTAQKETYGPARYELEVKGEKSTHWIWYIFPQIQGLGKSGISQKYAIQDLQQACRYLQHPTLFDRYSTLLGVVKTQLEKGNELQHLFGDVGKSFPVDSKKFISSITLFKRALEELVKNSTDGKYQRLLDDINVVLAIAQRQRFSPCPHTLSTLERGHSLPQQRQPGSNSDTLERGSLLPQQRQSGSSSGFFSCFSLCCGEPRSSSHSDSTVVSRVPKK